MSLQIKVVQWVKVMVKRWVLYGTIALITACSSQPEKETLDKQKANPEPSELVDIDSSVNLDTLWRDRVGKGSGSDYLRLTPKAVGSYLFVASYDGLLQRRDLSTGDKAWEQDLDVEITGAPGFSDGHLLIGTGTGELVKVKATDGSVAWKVRVSSEVLSEPVSDGDTIIVQTVDGKVSGHRFEDGARIWIYDSNLPVLSIRGTSKPLMRGPSVLLAFANGKIVSLSTKTGATQWEQRIGIPAGRSELERLVDIDGQLLERGPYVFALGYNGRFAALDPRNGRVLWDVEASGYAGPTAGLGNFYIVNDKSEVMAYDERTVAKVWSQKSLAGRYLSAPALIGSYMAVGDYDGYIHLLSQSDGSLVGRARVKRDFREGMQANTFDYRYPSVQYRRDDAITADIISAENHVIAFNKEGEIAVFRLSEEE